MPDCHILLAAGLAIRPITKHLSHKNSSPSHSSFLVENSKNMVDFLLHICNNYYALKIDITLQCGQVI